MQHRLGLGDDLHPAQHGPNASDQLTQPERLHEVVVGTELEEDHPIDLRAAGADDDDRHARHRAEPAADLLPVAVRQAEIEQHEIGRRRGQRLRRRACTLDGETVALETVHHRRGDGVVVLDHQDPHGRRLPHVHPVHAWVRGT